MDKNACECGGLDRMVSIVDMSLDRMVSLVQNIPCHATLSNLLDQMFLIYVLVKKMFEQIFKSHCDASLIKFLHALGHN